jgi:hypothetical protein
MLKPGDTLLYFQQSAFDWLVALKTWNFVAHCEIYVGSGQSVASRQGGVNLYPLRLDGLAYIRRPIMPFDFSSAMNWFSVPYNPRTGRGIEGQKYDYLGLLCFTLAVRQGSPHRMFCSEFATRWYRRAGLYVVAQDYDADRVAPAQLLQSPSLRTVWTRKTRHD